MSDIMKAAHEMELEQREATPDRPAPRELTDEEKKAVASQRTDAERREALELSLKLQMQDAAMMVAHMLPRVEKVAPGSSAARRASVLANRLLAPCETFIDARIALARMQ